MLGVNIMATNGGGGVVYGILEEKKSPLDPRYVGIRQISIGGSKKNEKHRAWRLSVSSRHRVPNYMIEGGIEEKSEPRVWYLGYLWLSLYQGDEYSILRVLARFIFLKSSTSS